MMSSGIVRRFQDVVDLYLVRSGLIRLSYYSLAIDEFNQYDYFSEVLHNTPNLSISVEVKPAHNHHLSSVNASTTISSGVSQIENDI
jgi:hypothetical protein